MWQASLLVILSVCLRYSGAVLCACAPMRLPLSSCRALAVTIRSLGCSRLSRAMQLFLLHRRVAQGKPKSAAVKRCVRAGWLRCRPFFSSSYSLFGVKMCQNVRPLAFVSACAIMLIHGIDNLWPILQRVRALRAYVNALPGLYASKLPLQLSTRAPCW